MQPLLSYPPAPLCSFSQDKLTIPSSDVSERLRTHSHDNLPPQHPPSGEARRGITAAAERRRSSTKEVGAALAQNGRQCN